MKDDKNMVFALHSYNPISLQRSGYLLFNDELKADYFLDICKGMNEKKIVCHYEKYQYVRVNNTIASKVELKNQYYVNDVNRCLHVEGEAEVSEKLNLSND